MVNAGSMLQQDGLFYRFFNAFFSNLILTFKRNVWDKVENNKNVVNFSRFFIEASMMISGFMYRLKTNFQNTIIIDLSRKKYFFRVYR